MADEPWWTATSGRSGAAVTVTPGLRYLQVSAQGDAVVLDAKRGRYWQLTPADMRRLHLIAGHDLPLEEPIPALDAQAVDALCRLGLVQRNAEVTPVSRTTCLRFARQYVIENLACQYRRRRYGWLAVSRYLDFSNNDNRHEVNSATKLQLVDALAGEIRSTAGLPGVSINCVDVAIATASVLAKNRLEARVVIGSLNWPFQGHMWVESYGTILDLSSTSAERSELKPLS